MKKERIVRPRRSFIFTPGLEPEMFPKALASGADIVCVELEDGIAPKDKEAARKRALALFDAPQAEDGFRADRTDQLPARVIRPRGRAGGTRHGHATARADAAQGAHAR